MIHLVIGGARSGKSSFAEQWCLALSQVQNQAQEQPLIYVATATAFDQEMNERIKQHQDDRDKNWQLVECPLALSSLIEKYNEKCSEECTDSQIILVDCLTLWLNNLIYSFGEKFEMDDAKQNLQQHFDQLVATLINTVKNKNLTITFVANEVGLGIIPLGASNRLYVDYAGWLNQAIAKIADKVTLVTAGIPLTLKDSIVEKNK
ncbi:MAG: bifunctional adenosylcobinamide kinase/adenosylcobinamide-phosphate guanylyltransferase [Colwellia sp.]|nr:bifunctional adenosylcobinamide kinase/adenosylcobinamide-phosphate guanylyltransferase [Colwellia sp.]